MNQQNHDSAEYMGLADRLFALILLVLPHHLLSSLMYVLTRSEWPPLKRLLIRAAIRVYRVDMEIAQEPMRKNIPASTLFLPGR